MVFLFAAVMAAATFTLTPSSASAAPVASTFVEPGQHEYVVPAGICKVTVDAYGAQGGRGLLGVDGGLGGRATATLTVTPGQALTVVVGGQGGDGASPTDPGLPGVGGPGGFNGGGDGGDASTGGGGAFPAGGGGGGGGASDVRTGAALEERVVVAGGGGGSTGNGTRHESDAAGAGGGESGTPPGPPLIGGATAPGGGTQTTGGAGGTYDGSGGGGPFVSESGSSGTGGDGFDQEGSVYGGGGGGGGWYGGGGGAFSGGGGGSGFGPAGVSFQTGVRSGDGLVTITADAVAGACVPLTTTVPAAGSRGSVAARSVDIAATGSGLGHVAIAGVVALLLGSVLVAIAPIRQHQVLGIHPSSTRSARRSRSAAE